MPARAVRAASGSWCPVRPSASMRFTINTSTRSANSTGSRRGICNQQGVRRQTGSKRKICGLGNFILEKTCQRRFPPRNITVIFKIGARYDDGAVFARGQRDRDAHSGGRVSLQNKRMLDTRRIHRSANRLRCNVPPDPSGHSDLCTHPRSGKSLVTALAPEAVIDARARKCFIQPRHARCIHDDIMVQRTKNDDPAHLP